jgi:hypothetical protein
LGTHIVPLPPGGILSSPPRERRISRQSRQLQPDTHSLSKGGDPRGDPRSDAHRVDVDADHQVSPPSTPTSPPGAAKRKGSRMGRLIKVMADDDTSKVLTLDSLVFFIVSIHFLVCFVRFFFFVKLMERNSNEKLLISNSETK